MPLSNIILIPYLCAHPSVTPMPTIQVVAAIIIRNGEVFATQRGYGEWKGWWEFPGGKIEPGECPQEALKREIKEELDADLVLLEKIAERL